MKAWLFLASFAFIYAIIASALTVYLGPGANGSGIAEIMAMLNGVNYPGYISYKSLFTKIFGVILAISASLCVGKEGPLAHIGAIVANIVIYNIPIEKFKYFQNDVHKREFMCAGISAGVSAAFAAPIGGAMFAYELSKPTTFWRFSMIWRIFFCASISTYTLSVWDQIHEYGFSKELLLTSAGTIKFGKLQDIQVGITHVHSAIILGIIGGLLGSLFISVNSSMTIWRKKYITTNRIKVLETGLYAVGTISSSVFFTSKMHKCYDINEALKDEGQTFTRWTCDEGQYSPLATLFFNTEGGTIKNLFHGDDYYTNETINLFIFISCWYFWTIVTYGVWIPAGLFLPGIIVGGAIGRMYTWII